MLKMIVSIDDLLADSKTILTAWGESHGIQLKDLRECENFVRYCLIAVNWMACSRGTGRG
jgi:hypothetical protein